ncbi:MULTISPECIES: LPXTG cell wall anchor domain-containing protein [Lactobacillus]|uniref:LPXTG cell wall anchor domain-containing protein n=1 Tax=Lactobacillus TaxID=1578 RepID=UPI000CD8470C|nr:MULTISPECIES: LPXTG cell wall anchor domain-containing protein [Lactobacillus]RVU73342.1 LPXTG cell wall anchor domain-containing protein [Lactobacillus xujianguonis]
MSLNNQRIVVNTVPKIEKIWDKDEIANDQLHPVVRNADGSYTEIPYNQALMDELPKVGEVVQVINSGFSFLPSTTTLYNGGEYSLTLAPIQAILAKYGYSVDPKYNDLSEIMDEYTYNTNPGLVIRQNPANEGIAPANNEKNYFYIEVHKIIGMKDLTFQAGSQAAKDWKYTDNVTGVFNVEHPTPVSVGHAYENVPASVADTKLVSITDQNGNKISTINGETPAGTYFVTVSYKLNNSDQKEILISDTAKVVITPKAAPTKPSEPKTPSTPPTAPSNQPSSPVVPVSPTTPVQPTNAPTETPNQTTDSNQTVAPHPEATPSKDEQGEKTVAPKDEKVPTKPAAKRAAAEQNLGNAKVGKLAAKSMVKKLANNAPVKGTKAELPQTGEKQSHVAIFGLVLAALASVTAFGLGRKTSKEKVGK